MNNIASSELDKARLELSFDRPSASLEGIFYGRRSSVG